MVMKETGVITIRHCLSQDFPQPCRSIRLSGFCDASTKANAAVVYVRLETQLQRMWMSSLSRPKPNLHLSHHVTIPRFELLSAVLLCKLITNICSTLESKLQVDEAVCFTDSEMSVSWIQGVTDKWKQFVEN